MPSTHIPATASMARHLLVLALLGGTVAGVMPVDVCAAHAASTSGPTTGSGLGRTAQPTTPQVAVAQRMPTWHLPDRPHAKPASTPTRIVSLAPVITETVFALGAGDRLVGVTKYCDRPREAQALPRVGGATDVSLERVFALRPDVILAVPAQGQRDVLHRAREAGIPVRLLYADRLNEVMAMVSDLGDVLATPDAAQALGERMGRALNALRDMSLPAKRAAIVVGHDPLVVAGPGTFSTDVLGLTGLASALPPSAPLWPVWSIESFSAARVDVLLVAEGPSHARALEDIVRRARLPTTIVVPARPVLMRPGPALIDDAEALTIALRSARVGEQPSTVEHGLSP